MVSLGSVGGRECASRSQRRPSALRRSPSDSQLLHILKKRTESEPIKRYAVEHMQACGQPRLYSRVTRDDPRLREMSHAGVRQLRLYSRGAGQAQARGEPRGAERSREEPRGSREEPRGAERSREEPRGAERSAQAGRCCGEGGAAGSRCERRRFTPNHTTQLTPDGRERTDSDRQRSTASLHTPSPRARCCSRWSGSAGTRSWCRSSSTSTGRRGTHFLDTS